MNATIEIVLKKLRVCLCKVSMDNAARKVKMEIFSIMYEYGLCPIMVSLVFFKLNHCFLSNECLTHWPAG